MKEFVVEAVEGTACERSPNYVRWSPSDACIEAFAIGSSRIEEGAVLPGCVKVRNRVRSNMTHGYEAN